MPGGVSLLRGAQSVPVDRECRANCSDRQLWQPVQETCSGPSLAAPVTGATNLLPIAIVLASSSTIDKRWPYLAARPGAGPRGTADVRQARCRGQAGAQRPCGSRAPRPRQTPATPAPVPARPAGPFRRPGPAPRTGPTAGPFRRNSPAAGPDVRAERSTTGAAVPCGTVAAGGERTGRFWRSLHAPDGPRADAAVRTGQPGLSAGGNTGQPARCYHPLLPRRAAARRDAFHFATGREATGNTGQPGALPEWQHLAAGVLLPLGRGVGGEAGA